MTKWHYKTADEPDWMPKRRRLDAHGRPELWVNPALLGHGAQPRPRRAPAVQKAGPKASRQEEN